MLIVIFEFKFGYSTDNLIISKFLLSAFFFFFPKNLRIILILLIGLITSKFLMGGTKEQ